MKSDEIRRRFLNFFRARGHAIIPSAPLVPQNDPSVLFNTAGMQPLAPYLLGAPHPLGKRLADVQKCARTGDLEEIGDNRHFSFFEMLGNWSLGDYFKTEAIQWSYEFITSKEEGLGLDAGRLYVTVFAGDDKAPRDDESARIWRGLGVPESRIYFLGAEDNWWSPGDNGPCGPDTEMFYDMTESGLGEITPTQFVAAVKNEDLVEIWNDVFMEYEKRNGKIIGKLANKNVDTGAGLERMSAVMQGKATAYDSDLFESVMAKIDEISSKGDDRSRRIVADHIRAAVFMVGAGVLPSNTDRGYVLRRLVRRAVRSADLLGMKQGSLFWIAKAVPAVYRGLYPEIENIERIARIIDDEEHKFREVLDKGVREFERISKDKTEINANNAFNLYASHGLPIDIIADLAREKNILVEVEGFEEMRKKHQELSRVGAAQKFKGGLADDRPETVRLHTAHHLLLAALQKVLGKGVHQRGSNITAERLRIDFSLDRKMTDEEKKRVEDLVNAWIVERIPVVRRDMPKAEAERLGAEMEFGATYGEIVSVYVIERADGARISAEFCGGPHVANTGELGHFSIQKEEAVAAGVRRIKAVLD